MASSPSNKCHDCRGRGRRFALDVRPASSGVPSQTTLEDGSVALWYPDGTAGVVRICLCPDCRGTGLRSRFGPCDVRAASRWARLCGLTLAEPTRARLRGTVVDADGAREGDAMAGEFFVSAHTDRPAEASTTALGRAGTA